MFFAGGRWYWLIRYFDLFAGIGGFRAGLDRAGGFECVGHCEIDKYAEAGYRAIHDVRKEEVFYTDAREIRPEELPEFELICAGFPCQSFSVAGRRAGFGDVRGTLFFEIAQLAEAKRPNYLLLENVPGLISHDGGRTFAKILGTLSDLGYGIEWSVLNSKHFGVPQSRKRLFIICYLDPRCAGEILPVFGTGAKALIPIIRGRQGYNVYSAEGVAQTRTASIGGFGGKTGLYLVGFNRNQTQNAVLLIKEATKSGYKEATPGDSVDLSFGGSTQGIVERSGRIRRLIPKECLRLQGFAEDQIDRLLAITSDAQAYKQVGNCVTVNVIEAIGRKLLAANNKLKEGENIEQ